MNKTILLFFLFFVIGYPNCHAQLDKLCPISSTINTAYQSTLQPINLLLNTKDFKQMYVSSSRTTISTSIQLVNAVQPFPPLWYQIGDPKADTLGVFNTTFFIDARIQERSGMLTAFYVFPYSFTGSVAFDTTTLLPIDTTRTYAKPNNETFRDYIDLHDFQIDKNGNKLFANQVLKKIDARCLSGNEDDSIRNAIVNNIIILDKHDSILLNWNLLDHLSACEMKWEYKDASLHFGNNINLSHVNSVRFANDGNILYSFRHIGVGKINIKTGEIMWKLGGKDTLNAIPIPDDADYYLQHDFFQMKNGNYIIFSNGDSTHQYLEGIIYNIDEKNKKASVVNRYRPQPNIYSTAQGSYECEDSICVINFGMHTPNKLDGSNQTFAEILSNNQPIATLSSPFVNYAYQVHATNWNPINLRPKVVNKNGKLFADKTTELHDFTWYKIEGTTAQKVGIGYTFQPTKSGNYVVEAQKGFGMFRSYLVSDVVEIN